MKHQWRARHDDIPVDWQTMYEQMAHRCQSLDQKLSEYEAMDMQKSHFVTEANSREQFAETLRLWADSTILMGVESLVTGVSPKELKDTLREVASLLTCNYDAAPKSDDSELRFLVNALKERYYGRMPEEVQKAYDVAVAALKDRS